MTTAIDEKSVNDWLVELLDKNDKLTAENKRLREALLPFAIAWNTTIEEEEAPHDAFDYVGVNDFEAAYDALGRAE